MVRQDRRQCEVKRIGALLDVGRAPAVACRPSVRSGAVLLVAGALQVCYVENSEIICLDSAISALSSIIGQIAIPVPVLGALVGNTAGTIMYEIAKGNLSQAEQKLVRQHMSAIEEQEQALASEHRQLVSEYELRMASFDSIIDLAFSEDVNMALPASLENARRAGVPDSMLLLTLEEQEEFFES